MSQLRTPAVIFDDFVNGRLGADEWTHEAHLITAREALRTRTPRVTLAFLRQAIQAHNCGIGIENGAASGYHETLTRYYVTAVAQAIGAGVSELQELFATPTCSRHAPLDYWTKERLFSPEARLGFVAPDIAATPWPLVGSETDSGSAQDVFESS